MLCKQSSSFQELPRKCETVLKAAGTVLTAVFTHFQLLSMKMALIRSRSHLRCLLRGFDWVREAISGGCGPRLVSLMSALWLRRKRCRNCDSCRRTANVPERPFTRPKQRLASVLLRNNTNTFMARGKAHSSLTAPLKRAESVKLS